MAVKLLGQVAAGSVVKIKENGTPAEFYVAKHDYESGLNGTGRTLVVRKDLYDMRQWHSSDVNIYASSDIDAWMNGGYKALFPKDIQTAMGTTKFYYTPGNGNNKVGTLERAIFALSLTELGESHSYANVEGSALPIASILKIAYRNGNANTQWTRSPHTGSTYIAWRLTSDGGVVNNACTYAYGSRPAFTLPATLYVSDDGSVMVSPPAPALTVPELAMQGQSVAVSWSELEGADSYTLQRKADTDADWVQVYTGAGLTFTETAGAWTSVQYRVQAVFGGVPGGWAQSAAIPVVSAAALVISGQDGDLGTIVNDVPYSVSTDTGKQIRLTLLVNGAEVYTRMIDSGYANRVLILDLTAGTGTITLKAEVQASSGTASAVRSWTYTKAAIPFETGRVDVMRLLDAGGTAQYPATVAEAVRLPGGKTLDQVTQYPAQVVTGSYVGTGTYGASNPNTLTFSFTPKMVFIQALDSDNYRIEAIYGKTLVNNSHSVSSPGISLNVEWEGNTMTWAYASSTVSGAGGQLNTAGTTYLYIALG